jgi:hypothetical protein
MFSLKKLIPIAFLFFYFPSNAQEANVAAFRTLDEALVKSNAVINLQSQATLHALQSKLTDNFTKYKAELWFPKAKLVQNYTSEVMGYIEQLKDKVSKGNSSNILKGSFSKEQEMELLETLKLHKQKLLAIDSLITYYIGKDVEIIESGVSFNNLPSIGALAMLSQVQNKIKIAENSMIQFCNENCTSTAFIIEDYRKYSLIVTQNVKRVPPGETLEIKAGIGFFNTRVNPIIRIGGFEMPLDESGVATYQFKAPNQIGTHKYPVTIEFVDGEGMKQNITKTVEFVIRNN